MSSRAMTFGLRHAFTLGSVALLIVGTSAMVSAQPSRERGREAFLTKSPAATAESQVGPPTFSYFGSRSDTALAESATRSHKVLWGVVIAAAAIAAIWYFLPLTDHS